MKSLKKIIKYLKYLLTMDAAKEYRECEQMIDNCWKMLEDIQTRLGCKK